MEKLQRKLKSIRAQLGVTQTEMAKLLNIGKSTYVNKEKGIVDFTVSEAIKICQLSGETFEDIFFNNLVHENLTKDISA